MGDVCQDGVHLPWGYLRRGFLLGEVSIQSGVYPVGLSAEEGVCQTPPCEQNDRCL